MTLRSKKVMCRWKRNYVRACVESWVACKLFIFFFFFISFSLLFSFFPLLFLFLFLPSSILSAPLTPFMIASRTPSNLWWTIDSLGSFVRHKTLINQTFYPPWTRVPCRWFGDRKGIRTPQRPSHCHDNMQFVYYEFYIFNFAYACIWRISGELMCNFT